MIISASRRTDIPAFYHEWFYNRIKEGYVLVRNPTNTHQISKVKLTPDVVDFIVFWTKNPAKMIDRLDELKDYNYYFQFTLTSYGKDIEENVPFKSKEIIPIFKKLSNKIGAEKVIWRYDPILLSKKYTIDYHCENFEKIAKNISGYTKQCVISFLDFYKKIDLESMSIEEFTTDSKNIIAKNISKIAKQYNFSVSTCSENINLKQYGITQAHCIDAELMERLTNYNFKVSKDKSQRKECGCVQSIDIGAYNTCSHGCKYCYATFNKSFIEDNKSLHNPKSPLLVGNICADKDEITERKVKSIITPKEQRQLNLDL